jgi:hypothetical protein
MRSAAAMTGDRTTRARLCLLAASRAYADRRVQMRARERTRVAFIDPEATRRPTAA